MMLNDIRDAFEKVTEDQWFLSLGSELLTDQTIDEMEKASSILKLESNSDHKSILKDLKSQLQMFYPGEQLRIFHENIAVSFNKYVSILRDSFIHDISAAHINNIDFDIHILNRIIANHFYQQGEFDLGDSLMNEYGQSNHTQTLKSEFIEMYKLLDCVRSGNTDPVLHWLSTSRDKLGRGGSDLELKIHKLRFVDILKSGRTADALAYASAYLAPLAEDHDREIQKLMTCLLWSGRIDEAPPYLAEMLGPKIIDDLASEVAEVFCNALGFSRESPLSVVMAAGFEVLPNLLETEAASPQWVEPAVLSRRFWFHSVYAGKRSLSESGLMNPLLRIPCGHVVIWESLAKLIYDGMGAFRCPICVQHAQAGDCMRLVL